MVVKNMPCYWLTDEQWTDIMYSVIGVSPCESNDPEDMTEYPIPDGVDILKFVRNTQKLTLDTSVDTIFSSMNTFFGDIPMDSNIIKWAASQQNSFITAAMASYLTYRELRAHRVPR
jgi:hypothetical protein